jgi:hypothetical protein
VAKLDNPAGRLYELLSAYREVASDTQPIINAWAQVFGVGTRWETLLRIAETLGLIPEIEAAVERSGDEEQIALFRDFVGDWVAGVAFPDRNLYANPSVAMSSAISQQNLRVLGGLSSFLSATASEGPVPSPDQLAGLRGRVQQLIDSITEDSELPEDIRRAALDHAYRLAQALDHFRIGGPGAVKAATERLVGATVLAPDRVRKSPTWTNLLAVGGAVWTVFMVTGEAQQALEAWETLFKELPGGDS